MVVSCHHTSPLGYFKDLPVNRMQASWKLGLDYSFCMRNESSSSLFPHTCRPPHNGESHSNWESSHHSQEPSNSHPEAGHYSREPSHGHSEAGHRSREPSYGHPEAGHHSWEPSHGHPEPGHHSREPSYGHLEPGHHRLVPGPYSPQPRTCSSSLSSHPCLEPCHQSPRPSHLRLGPN